MTDQPPIQAKPLLIYDGDCGFCQYWVNYWNKLTGDAVDYKPYQEVAEDFPNIPIEDFQKAVQYVAPDGTVSSAAKASFLTLSHAKGRRWLLGLYRYLPGFSFIAEKSYALVASHRSFFYAICLFFWGKELETPTHHVLAWIFLRAFALVFLIAFISFGTQAMGLIGSKGIVPIASLIDATQKLAGVERFWQVPMLFWFNASDIFIQFICWSGAVFSVLLFLNNWPRFCLLAVYICYLSLIYAGQFFMTFQWDTYLLETAIICFFLIGSVTIGTWLLRWLVFRFIFLGGVVKMTSGDPAWQDFTALNYYFNTEPLPTPLAWYAHHLPHAVLKAGSLLTLAVELAIPFFIFLPKRLRYFAAFIIIIFQTIIMITGNYNWFNILTIFLCLILFDDSLVRCFMPTRWFNRLSTHIDSSPNRIWGFFALLFAVLTVPVGLTQIYARFGGKAPMPIVAFDSVITPFRIVNTYGPFAVITKQRMEIIFEGSDDAEHWKEYAFKYKPGDVNRRPPWNIPFQPRLDWQMWFAALGPPTQSPWLYNLMQRLLENEHSVLKLFENTPFPNAAPRYVRALFYEYNFTTEDERNKTGAWWKRDLVGYYIQDASLPPPSS
jgi:predicted DCC family thiol-disulfide oxidoreductase YuxK